MGEGGSKVDQEGYNTVEDELYQLHWTFRNGKPPWVTWFTAPNWDVQIVDLASSLKSGPLFFFMIVTAVGAQRLMAVCPLSATRAPLFVDWVGSHDSRIGL